MLEPRLADELGAGIGDEITGPRGVEVRVVGVGVGPQFGSGAFGDQALMTPAGAERLGETDAFTEVVVDVAPGQSVDEVFEGYGEDYELTLESPPPDIANLSQLGRLPQVLTAFLAIIGLGAMANALWLAARRRRRDIAVLRVIGHTPRQAMTMVATMAVVATALGLAIGLPVGAAVGRTIWRLVAEGASVEGDALVTLGVLVALPLAVVAVALVVAAPAAWLAGRRRPGPALRAE
jgi:ABC-type antimicrobial peptide transport system permease subunit